MNWVNLLIPIAKTLYALVDKFMSVKSQVKTALPMHDREVGLKYIFSYVGNWYKWGGDDPSGFDCSGFAIEYLKSIGKLPRKYDNTAEGLWQRFKDKYKVSKPKRGCLVFWGDGKKCVHVEIMITDKFAIGASGGGSKTITPSDAIRDNAFIKVRPIASRAGIVGYIDPFKN